MTKAIIFDLDSCLAAADEVVVVRTGVCGQGDRTEDWSQLSTRKKSRTSVMMACGSSQAAKCPPLA
jgi:hypothetical protein